MTEKIIIAGSGGQGVMLLGKILAEAAMRENKFVSWLPSYGPEVRGGTAHCMVIISDEEIGSPYIKKADTLIIMNELSYLKFQQRLKNKGLLFLNSSLVKEAGKNSKILLQFPFTDLALELGNTKVANMIALGALVAKKGMFKIKNILTTIEEVAPEDKKDLVEINQKALLKGVELVK